MEDTGLSWLISFRNPLEIWEFHANFLAIEFYCIFIGGLGTFLHAWRNGGRWLYLWIAIIMHGLFVECVCYMVPSIDNFWHAQATIMLLGKRLPLAIIFLYPTFIYTASVAVERLKLSSWAEPFAVGIFTVILDIPYDIIGVKFLFWTWHDTDPNIYDRHYWVPWTSYYFHAAFAFSLTFLIHGWRRFITGKSKYETDVFWKEILCCILTGCMAMPLGVLQFIPFYHPFHDVFQIHTEVCVLILLGAYILIVWKADRNPRTGSRPVLGREVRFDEIALLVLVHFSQFVIMAVFSKPENVVSTGLHEPTGPCNETEPVFTPVGMVLSKRKFLCVSDYDEAYYDFHCVGDVLPPDGTAWYTVCGTPFPNHIEYILVVGSFAALGIYSYMQLLLSSSPAKDTSLRKKRSKQKTN